jgi:pyruvate-formate lyase-activating enzyme
MNVKMEVGMNNTALTKIPIPHSKVSITPEELSLFQTVSSYHISFSLTLDCPLQCAHCIVGAGPDKKDLTLSMESARHYADQMQELFTYGIRSVGFTGGEPILAEKQLKLLSDTAYSVGMLCGVVTSAFWAKDPNMAESIIERYPGIKIWDISVDKYHAQFVSLSVVRKAYEILRQRNKTVNIRFVYHDSLDHRDIKIIESINDFAQDIEINFQRLRNYGRAKDTVVNSSFDCNPWSKPCLTTGMVIRYDDSVAPCCCSMIEERNHPFQFGNGREKTLLEIHRDFISYPLLQLMRTIGFSELMTWLMERPELMDRLPDMLPDDICDLCPILFSDKEIGSYLSQRAAQPANVLKTAVLACKILKEKEMLKRLVKDYQGRKINFKDLELIEAMLNDMEHQI